MGTFFDLLQQAEKNRDTLNEMVAENGIGWANMELENYREAITWFQKAIAIDHQRAIAYLNLADAYVRVGKPKDAKQNYEKFLQLSPTSANADEVRQRIVELQDKQ